MTLATVDAWWNMEGVDVISVDALLWAAYMLWFADPWRDFRHVRRTTATAGGGDDDGAEGIRQSQGAGMAESKSLIENSGTAPMLTDAAPNIFHEQRYPSPLAERIPWVGTLLLSICLNNWKIGQPSHDRLQPAPPAFSARTPFIKQTLLSVLRGFLVLDLTRAYVSYDAYFIDPTVAISSALPFQQLAWIPPQLLRSAIIGAQAWALISQMFYLPCLFPVGLNALGLLSNEWSPHTWPPYYGSPRTIFLDGVRGFWGDYWHRSMRAFSIAPGYAIADMLGLRGGSLIRYAIITTAAFGLSGFIHTGLVPPEPLHATIPVNIIRLHVAAFFWLQPFAILAETVTVRLIQQVVPTNYWQSGVGLRLRMLANTMFVIAWAAWAALIKYSVPMQQTRNTMLTFDDCVSLVTAAHPEAEQMQQWPGRLPTKILTPESIDHKKRRNTVLPAKAENA
ncbi:hypothetical protein LTR37_019880 [Vermiconidia calcicola]|uniref:Uncharacterized protein n=1 Tax=Vermiconidia calcicola TaxID=1690605 RepID=A0ACC3MCZ7_9PEZI|nr:hypothetical protein LTR37_019880 [Vermiconidia calcicola]